MIEHNNHRVTQNPPGLHCLKPSSRPGEVDTVSGCPFRFCMADSGFSSLSYGLVTRFGATACAIESRSPFRSSLPQSWPRARIGGRPRMVRSEAEQSRRRGCPGRRCEQVCCVQPHTLPGCRLLLVQIFQSIKLLHQPFTEPSFPGQ